MAQSGVNMMREDLERILIWLQREAPHLAVPLQAGLSIPEMQQIMGAKASQYRIPEEIVEMYAWRNGQQSCGRVETCLDANRRQTPSSDMNVDAARASG
jgi:hypothetical protein